MIPPSIYSFKSVKGSDGKRNAVIFHKAKRLEGMDESDDPAMDSPPSNRVFRSERQKTAVSKLLTDSNLWEQYWARRKPPKPQILVFFPGDGQVESGVHDEGLFADWNLERTTEYLSKTFPDRHIIVIKPVRHLRHIQAAYANFVQSSDTSIVIPSHSDDPLAVPHLRMIFNDLRNQILAQDAKHGSWAAALSQCDLWNGGIDIIGFSRGCVVLNQLLHELGVENQGSFSEEDRLFMDRISSMTWLDGGHSGPEKTWITDTGILYRALVLRKIAVRVVVSAYQIKDTKRPIIAIEEKEFSDYMEQNLTATFKRLELSGMGPGTLSDHFEVLHYLR